jgi:hypothetical protein
MNAGSIFMAAAERLWLASRDQILSGDLIPIGSTLSLDLRARAKASFALRELDTTAADCLALPTTGKGQVHSGWLQVLETAGDWRMGNGLRR